MACSSSTTLPLSSSSAFIDVKAPRCISLPTPPPPPLSLPQNRAQTSWKPTSYCRRSARNVIAMAAGDGPVVATAEPPAITTADASAAENIDLPEFVQTLQQAWDKVDDKYAVASVGVAVFVALWSSAGLISAIDKLPLLPGVLELVGLGYTGWFAYHNLVFKPERDALIKKVKDTYSDITGAS